MGITAPGSRRPVVFGRACGLYGACDHNRAERMCGRYMVISSPEAIRRLFGYPEQPNFPPRYNVAPTQPVPIVRLVDGQRQFALVRWGLIPPWVKDPRQFSLLINARGESVNDKPAFRNAMRRRRCLFPADGFYEWKDEGGRKRPVLRAPEGRRADRVRRAMGNLDGAERRGDGDRRHRHHRGQPGAGRAARPHAGDRAARGVRSVARLPQGRRHDRHRADRAGARRAARRLRGLAGGQPRRQ